MADTQALQAVLDLLSPAKLLASLVVLAAAWLSVLLLKLTLQRLAQRFNRYRLQITRLLPMLRVLIWTAALVLVLFAVLRPPQNVALAVLASAGIAVGLGAQDLARNLFAGLMILFDPPYRVGDMVRVGGHYGEVHSIGLNATRLHTFDDSLVTVPNAEMLRHAVTNSNAGALVEMIEVDFDLPARINTAAAKALAWDCAVCSPYAYLKKPVVVMVGDRFDHGFLTRLTVKVYVVDNRHERVLASDITERFKGALAARGLIGETDLRSWQEASAGIDA